LKILWVKYGTDGGATSSLLLGRLRRTNPVCGFSSKL
jgi:hypothetical protein